MNIGDKVWALVGNKIILCEVVRPAGKGRLLLNRVSRFKINNQMYLSDKKVFILRTDAMKHRDEQTR